jgi:hypothetical protein
MGRAHPWSSRDPGGACLPSDRRGGVRGGAPRSASASRRCARSRRRPGGPPVARARPPGTDAPRRSQPAGGPRRASRSPGPRRWNFTTRSAQVLTAVIMSLARAKSVSGPAAHRWLDESFGIVKRAIQNVRDLSLELRPAMLDDLGLVAALRWYLISSSPATVASSSMPSRPRCRCRRS